MNLIKNTSLIIALTFAFIASGSALRSADNAAPLPPMPQLPVLEQLAEFLGLSADQVNTLIPIVTKGKNELVALEAKGLPKAQSIPEATKIVKATNDEIRKHLTPEQLQKFDALMEEARKKLKEEMMKRANMGGSAPPTGTPPAGGTP